jgi:hypothetical protein
MIGSSPRLGVGLGALIEADDPTLEERQKNRGACGA